MFDEALRLFPPAVGLLRKVTEDTTLAGYRLPAGTLVFVNIANIQRHSEFWDDPDIFRPERFLSGQPKPAHRLAYMPFGAGPRICPGNHFALTEGVLLLATIAQHYQLDLLEERAAEPEIVLTLRPKGGMRMAVSKRSMRDERTHHGT